MKIYFACSITGGRAFEPVYQAMVGALVSDGHQVLTAHLAEPGAGEKEAVLLPQEVYARDVGWILASDVLIAEVSVPSHGVGYEIGFALGAGKPVLALYEQGCKVSKMISGNPDAHLHVKAYHEVQEGIQIVRNFLKEIAGGAKMEEFSDLSGTQ
jgi:nucleoside 2-deoxyribosyltransferase